MTKALDLSGKRFGNLLAISPCRGCSGRTAWLCKCDCGKETIVDTGNLVSGRVKSCGCSKKKKDLSGQSFGELTVLQFDGYYKRNPKWLCKCSCGETISAFENGLKNGSTKNCGGILHNDLIGKRFGRLTVLPEVRKGKSKSSRRYLCLCDCGNKTWVTAGNLMSGNTKSCGCFSLETASKRATTHGMSKTRIYNIWIKMLARCEKEYDNCYKRYGAKGISVCEAWHDFETFFKWATENGYREDLTIDRIDGSGDYEPSNCRWATYQEQANNLNTNVIVEYNGEKKTLSQWAKDYDIPYKVLHNRYKARKWDFERALTQPIRQAKSRKREQ